MVNVMDPATVDSLLQNAPDRVVNPISRKHVEEFLPGNLVIILLAPYPFSTLRTLIKTLSSFDNILFINKITS